jgi:hypothetical protein
VLQQLKNDFMKTYTLPLMNDFNAEILSCTLQLVMQTDYDKHLAKGMAQEGAVA